MTELDLLDRPTEASAEKSRLFLATFLEDDAPADAQHRAIGLRHGHALRGRSLGPSRFHVTLEFFGTYRCMPWGLVEQIVRALEGFEFDAFDVAFDAAASFPDKPFNRPLVMLGDVGVEALKTFQHRLGTVLAEAGLCEAPHPDYTPHVTLLYDDRIVAPQRIAPVKWRMREFVLVQSVQGKTLHIPLARWRARGA
jgi:2'-5' RNA ligase